MSPSATPHRPFLVPTLTKQSWLFMVGATLFAVGSAAAIWGLGGSSLGNILCFVGAWFFTTAGFIQLMLSGDATASGPRHSGILRAEWVAAATQSFGTVMFNVSTTAALAATQVHAERFYVWSPDAGGSAAFLISAVFVYVAYYRTRGRLWEPRRADWWAAHINMIGCIAFGFSAVGSWVLSSGTLESSLVSNWGTFIGALCFFLASLIVLPALPWNRADTASRGEEPATTAMRRAR